MEIEPRCCEYKPNALQNKVQSFPCLKKLNWTNWTKLTKEGWIKRNLDWTASISHDLPKSSFPLLNNVGSALTLGGDPWTAPVTWSSVYPSLHLSLDDAESFTLHNGVQHVLTEVWSWLVNNNHAIFSTKFKHCYLLRRFPLCHWRIASKTGNVEILINRG